MHDTLADRGFTVLGFPCNQFGAQEPGTDAEILAFATDTYGVTFPMFSKVEVNGADACVLYQWLTAERPKDDGDRTVAWNFTKFLIGRNGEALARYEPQVAPENLGPDLEQYL